jgi:site-specific DNA-methyltransferase (adenine-specific)
MIELNKIYNEDCFNVMPDIDDKSIDMILCDLPYGTTACSWDTIIPFEPLWKQYKRIIKDNGAIVLTASQPFTSKLIMSNLEMFRYEWIWEKNLGTGYPTAKKRPIKVHENVLIFSKKQTVYNPQKTTDHKRKTALARHKNKCKPTEIYGKCNNNKDYDSTERYPRSVQFINKVLQKDYVHTTQKPVALFEYFIRTYTNEGDTVLDNCAGSFTTAVACIRTNRNWICVEKEKKNCAVGAERIKVELSQPRLF